MRRAPHERRHIDRRITDRLLISLSALIACACASPDPTGSAACTFTYDDAFKQNVFVPILKEAYGSNYKIFDINDAVVVPENKMVRITILSAGIISDPPKPSIIFDPCKRQVVAAYESPGYGFGPDRPLKF